MQQRRRPRFYVLLDNALSRLHWTTKSRIIMMEALVDLAVQSVHLTIVFSLIFDNANAAQNQLFLCLVKQITALGVCLIAGLSLHRIGIKQWIMTVLLCKAVLALILALPIGDWMTVSTYLLFISLSPCYDIGRNCLVRLAIPREGIISFRATYEKISLVVVGLGVIILSAFTQEHGKAALLVIAGFLFLSAVACAVKLTLPRNEDAPSAPPSKNSSAPGMRLSDFAGLLQTLKDVRKQLFQLGVTIWGCNLLFFGLPLLVDARFMVDKTDWALIAYATQAGSFFGMHFTSRIKIQQNGKPSPWLDLFFPAAGAGMFFLPGVESLRGMLVFMPLLGFALTLQSTFLEGFVQRQAPGSRKQLKPFMALLMAFNILCSLGAALLGAMIYHVWSLEYLFLLGAAIMFMGVFANIPRHVKAAFSVVLK